MHPWQRPSCSHRWPCHDYGDRAVTHRTKRPAHVGRVRSQALRPAWPSASSPPRGEYGVQEGPGLEGRPLALDAATALLSGSVGHRSRDISPVDRPFRCVPDCLRECGHWPDHRLDRNRRDDLDRCLACVHRVPDPHHASAHLRNGWTDPAPGRGATPHIGQRSRVRAQRRLPLVVSRRHLGVVVEGLQDRALSAGPQKEMRSAGCGPAGVRPPGNPRQLVDGATD